MTDINVRNSQHPEAMRTKIIERVVQFKRIDLRKEFCQIIDFL